MLEIIPVYRVRTAVQILYDLLKERTPDQSISHKEMPTMEEHSKFFHSNPYLAWYIIKGPDRAFSLDPVEFKKKEFVGSTYITQEREIGIFIFKEHHGKGYGTQAINEIIRKWPGPIYANINPKNKASIALFEKLGAKHIQNTYLIK